MTCQKFIVLCARASECRSVNEATREYRELLCVNLWTNQLFIRRHLWMNNYVSIYWNSISRVIYKFYGGKSMYSRSTSTPCAHLRRQIDDTNHPTNLLTISNNGKMFMPHSQLAACTREHGISLSDGYHLSQVFIYYNANRAARNSIHFKLFTLIYLLFVLCCVFFSLSASLYLSLPLFLSVFFSASSS